MLQKTLEEAGLLPTIPESAWREYELKSDILLLGVNNALENDPALHELIGGNPLSMMRDNHNHHRLFMLNIFRLGCYELLARTIPWVYRAYCAHGFSPDYFLIELAAWRQAVTLHLDPGNAESILRIYNWMLESHERMTVLAETLGGTGDVEPGQKWHPIYRTFLSHLIRGESREVIRMASDSVANPADLADFYLGLLQPCLYQIGRMWECGEISVAEEHLATAVVGRIMAGFYPRFLTSAQSRGKAMVSSVLNEHHEVGARMVADLLELDGWDTYFLGADTPIADLLEFVSADRFDMIFLSVTMSFNIHKAWDMVRALRDRNPKKDLRVMVGGQAFSMTPELTEKIGADGTAQDAAEAVRSSAEWWESR